MKSTKINYIKSDVDECLNKFEISGKIIKVLSQAEIRPRS